MSTGGPTYSRRNVSMSTKGRAGRALLKTPAGLLA
jgi:hypothetical protein